jgi:hypothetical protein
MRYSKFIFILAILNTVLIPFINDANIFTASLFWIGYFVIKFFEKREDEKRPWD